MRYRLAALMLFAMLSVMSLLIRPAPAPAILDIESPSKAMDPVAAPDPEPYGILDIGPPPKGETAEQYRQRQSVYKTGDCTLSMVSYRVRKLPSVAPLANTHPWLVKNLRVTAEEGDRRLRFTFGAGTRAERAAIINAFLRVSVSSQESTMKSGEEHLRIDENRILRVKLLMKRSQDPRKIASYQKAIDYQRCIRIPELRAEIARLKQYVVIRWAR
ncbi:MAG TPA: hypothetical protein VH575_18090 [Gemmataceae bacterium]|jgi:hypothetical protein